MKILIVSFLFGIVSINATLAEGVRDCDQALVRSTYSSISADHLDSHLATLVTEDTYYAIQHDGQGSATIYGIPMGASYKDFQTNVRKAVVSSNSSLTHDQALNILWTGLDPAVVSTYSKCIDGVALSSFGLHLAVRYATKSDIAIIVKWVPSFSQPDILKIRWNRATKQVDGTPLPRTVTNGSGVIIILARPSVQKTVAINSDAGGDSVVLDILPTLPPPPKCGKKEGPFNFYGDGCGDGYSVSGHVVIVNFGHGGSTVIPKNNPAYHADLGFWKEGDFNGDGLTDLIHFVVKVPGVDPYVHVHFSKGKGEFAPPTAGFKFGEHGNLKPGHRYDANIGEWRIQYDPQTGRDSLVHDPKSDGRIHVWRPNGDGTFPLGSP